MENQYFITTFWGRYIASSVLVFVASALVTLISGGGSFSDIFMLPWFPFVWVTGQGGIWQPLPLAFITLLILGIAALERWMSLIATIWFVLNTLLALWVYSVYKG